MIRIRRIYGTVLPSDRQAIAQVQEIFRQNFPDVGDYARKIPEMLDFPFRKGYQAFLLVSEAEMNRVTGFCLLLHFPEINSTLLDFLAVGRAIRGGGLGSALYEAAREHLLDFGSRGLYMEVLPDDPAVVRDKAMLEENRRRLRFYEHYGVRPIVGTDFETPIDDSAAPYLLFDGLGRKEPLGRGECRAAVRLILRRKYEHVVGPDYIERVVESVVDDPVRFRPPRYVPGATESAPVRTGRVKRPFVMIVSDRHIIHHVRDRGYVERPARVGAMHDALAETGLFETVAPRHFGEDPIRAVHDGGFVNYLRDVCSRMESRGAVYPYVFPIRRPERRPKDLALRAGYYCIDTFTPLDRNAYKAARAAVDTALTGAELVLAGRPVVYALCRPPGHHAERRVFGGFCYFNNAAIAAHRLSRQGKVALLDVDFHHGNGAQDIFYQRADVLTVSIHGHPNYAYPYFSGFADEVGEGPGKGLNRNFPLPDGTDEARYLQALDSALGLVRRFRPDYLVICLGLDTMRGDPTGGFTLTAGSLEHVARRIRALDLPTLVVQEGGYSLRNLRRGAQAFFRGMLGQARPGAAPPAAKKEVTRNEQDDGIGLRSS